VSISGIKVRYELPNQSSNFVFFFIIIILFYDLCNSAVSVSCSDRIASNGRMMVNHELERI